VKPFKSIHAQLTFFYSIAVVSLLVIVALAFYWETQNVMREADYNFIKEEESNLQSIMSDAVIDTQLLKKAVVEHPVRTRNSLYRYYVRVFDEQGQVIMETPGIESIISRPDPLQISTGSDAYLWGTYRGDQYLTSIVPVKTSSGAIHGYIQVALDATYQHTITHDRRVFVGMLSIAMLLSLLLGKFITSRGLRALNILTDTVKDITTSSLNQRVQPALLPKELNPLGNAFNQMLDRIETSFARMHQMSADMSHELRTPITNLIGQTELLLSYEHSEHDYRNAQASNLEELQRIASLIENILFLSRAESQQPGIDKQKVHAAAEIVKICDYYQALADDKQITIMQDGDAELMVNTIMFRRLMSNLISNAIKYTPEHGSIKIDVNEIDNDVCISVIDSGIGIDQQHISRLFDRFYRVDDSRSMQISGTGLGLSIVKSIVDLHHGSIRIQSEVDVGTKIEVLLPKT
jgi:two-component system heavy metal sensor histidine kinase CusS